MVLGWFRQIFQEFAPTLLLPNDIGQVPILVINLGKPPKQIFGKSWEFGPTGLPPPRSRTLVP